MNTGESLNPQERKIYAQESVQLIERISRGEADASLLQQLNKEVLRAVATQVLAPKESELQALENTVTISPELIKQFYEEVVRNGGHTPARDNYVVHNIAEEVRAFMATIAPEGTDQETKKPGKVWRMKTPGNWESNDQ